jgi:hypothetical protein
MPSLTATTVAANYNQVGNVNGLGGYVRILNAARSNMTTAQVNTLVKKLMQGGTKGTDDAVSIAGLGTADGSAFETGVTDNIQIAIQGTGAITVGADWNSTGFTLSLLAVFEDKDVA